MNTKPKPPLKSKVRASIQVIKTQLTSAVKKLEKLENAKL